MNRRVALLGLAAVAVAPIMPAVADNFPGGWKVVCDVSVPVRMLDESDVDFGDRIMKWIGESFGRKCAKLSIGRCGGRSKYFQNI